MDFYERVKTLVKEKTDQTLKGFIESLDLNYETYNGQRRYNNVPRADDALKISRALGVSLEYLLTGQSTSMQEINVDSVDVYLKEIERLVGVVREALQNTKKV